MSRWKDYKLPAKHMTWIESKLWTGLEGCLWDHFVYAPSQWETTLQWSIISLWLELIGIILCMRLANERQCYNVTLSLICWAYTQNDPCCLYESVAILCHYNVVNLFLIPHNRHPISCPWMVSFVSSNVVHVLNLTSHCCIKYHVIDNGL